MKKTLTAIAAFTLIIGAAITTASAGYGPCSDARGNALDPAACKAYYAHKAQIVPMPDLSGDKNIALLDARSGAATQFRYSLNGSGE